MKKKNTHTKKKTAPKSQKLNYGNRLSWLLIALFTTVFAALGTYLITNSHAATVPRLAWAPWPTTTSTITVNVPKTGLEFFGDPSKDYVFVFPKTAVTPKPGVGCLSVNHVRMAKIIGGECKIPQQPLVYDHKIRRCLSFNDIRSWNHVEGFWCHGDVLDFAEYSGSSATVTYENIRVEGINARDEVNFSDDHPDGVYVYPGIAPGAHQVRVDRATIQTDYQALFFAHWTGGAAANQNYPVYIRNTNVRGTPIPGTHYAQLLWRADNRNALYLTNVYLQPQKLGNGTTEPLIAAVKPSNVDPVVGNRAIKNSDGSISWPATARIIGKILPGSPAGGDFVPVGVAGYNYVSPGYNY